MCLEKDNILKKHNFPGIFDCKASEFPLDFSSKSERCSSNQGLLFNQFPVSEVEEMLNKITLLLK